MAVVHLAVEQRWECPACGLADVTVEPRPHSRFHRCHALAGLAAPMVPAGTRAKVEAVERGDYVGTDDVQYDGNGRPIQAVVTTRDDGQDCTVYAPCAHGSTRED